MKYLESRGLKSSEMIDRFQLGFANRTLGYRLPAKNRAAGAEMRGRLQQLGILRESGHEHFNGSVVIPVFGAEGEVVEMYGHVRGNGPHPPAGLCAPAAYLRNISCAREPSSSGRFRRVNSRIATAPRCSLQ